MVAIYLDVGGREPDYSGSSSTLHELLCGSPRLKKPTSLTISPGQPLWEAACQLGSFLRGPKCCQDSPALVLCLDNPANGPLGSRLPTSLLLDLDCVRG